MTQVRTLATFVVTGVLGSLLMLGLGMAQQPTAGSSVTIAGVATPTTLDSEFVGGSPQSWEVSSNCYDSLFGYPTTVSGAEIRRDFRQTSGRLIDRAEPAADGVTWTLHLRRGVRDAGGDEMSAEDIRWSFERGFAINTATRYLSSLVNLTSASNVIVKDPYTIQVKLDSFSPIFERRFTLYYPNIYNAKVAKAHATAADPWAKEWLKTHCAGFGPYTVAAFEPGTQVVLRANPNYWEGKPPTETVVYRAIPESSNRLALLKRGDADIALALSPQELASLKSESSIVIKQHPGNTVIPLYMNTKMPPFDSPAVRRALSHAVNYEAITRDIYLGYAQPIRSPIPTVFPDYDASAWPYTYDPQKAKRMLSEAGYPNGFGFKLTYAELTPGMRSVAIFVQSELQKIGVKMDLDLMSPATFQQLFRAHSREAYMYSIQAHVLDAGFAMQISFGKGLPLNAANYESARAEELFGQAQRTRDSQQRGRLLRDLQRVIVEDAPWLFLATEDYVVGLRGNVSGFGWYPDAGLKFWYLRKS